MPPEIGKTISAQSSFDHRIIYLEYEGPISGNRGAVVRWDKGSFVWKEESQNHLRVDLSGEVLTGLVDLVRDPDGQWQLTVTD